MNTYLSKFIKSETLIAVLAFFAMLVSAFLVRDHFNIVAGKGISLAFCDASSASGCRTVALSAYAEVLNGIPVALIGFSFFSAYLLASLFIALRKRTSQEFRLAIWVLHTGAVILSAFYVGIMAFVLRDVCKGCMLVHALNFIAYGLRCRLTLREFDWKRLNVFSLVKVILGFCSFMVVLTGTIFSTLRPVTDLTTRQFQMREDDAVIEVESDFKLKLGKEGEVIPVVMAIDLSCPHCKENLLNLTEALVALKKRAEVSFLFFPMDSECNSNLDTRLLHSCTATRLAICRARDHQIESVIRESLTSNFNLIENPNDAVAVIESDPAKQIKLKECMASPETEATLKKMTNPHPGNVGFSLYAVPTTWTQQIRITGRANSHEWAAFLSGKLTPKN